MYLFTWYKGILKELISLIQSLIKFKSLWKTVKKTACRVEQTCTIKKLYKSKSLQSRMQVNKVIMSNRDTQAKIGQNSIEGSYLSRSSKNVFDVHVNNMCSLLDVKWRQTNASWEQGDRVYNMNLYWLYERKVLHALLWL